MARDNRTRLNAELAHQYNGSRKKGGAVTPGRSSLTEALDETADVELEEETEAQTEGPAQEAQPPERESRKSIFELPRREAARAPVLPGYSEPDASAEAPPEPAPPPSSSTRRR